MSDLAKLREALGLTPDSPDDEVRAALSAQFPTPVTEATVVVSTSVWEDQQKTIRELSEFVAKAKRDERERVLVKTLRELRDFVAQRKRDEISRESDSVDAEFAALFPPSGTEDDSVDPAFRELFPHEWMRAGIDAERLATFPSESPPDGLAGA